MSKLMEKDVHKAAVDGDLTIFNNKNHEQLLKKTYKNDNIIHVAALHKQHDFIKAVLSSFPGTTCESLLRDQNSQGNTPLHIVAQIGEETVVDRLYEFLSTQCGDASGSDLVFPWRMVNSEGNTPAHVALMYGNVSVAMYLVEKDSSLALVTNHSKETLLHLVIQHYIYDNSQTEGTNLLACWAHITVLPIIEVLLKKERSLACWANINGSTPLHLATSLDSAYCIQVTKAILVNCPEAAAVLDERSKQTFLHLLTNHRMSCYMHGKEVLKIPEVNALINIMDNQGDTPLHLAARNKDTVMIQVLLDFSPKLDLTNKSGVSLRSLHPQLLELFISKPPWWATRNRFGRWTEEVNEAAKGGDVGFLNQQLVSSKESLLSFVTHTGGNILHALLQCNFNDNSINGFTKFIEQAIKLRPSLINQQDRNGNTLVHLIADKKYSYTLGTLICDQLSEMEDKNFAIPAEDGPQSSLFGLRNVNGDTPLHVAVRARNYHFAIQLRYMDYKVAGFLNNRKQSPLHLLSLRSDCNSDLVDDLIIGLMHQEVDPSSMRDEDGLTPLLSAVRERNFFTIQKLHYMFPGCTEIADLKGRTLWHWFGSRRLERDVSSAGDFDGLMGQTEACKFLIDQDVGGQIRKLMASKDNDGNTPLHLAIQNQQFDFALFFLDNWRVDWSLEKKYDALLSVENKKGVSSYDLIGAAEHLPGEFEKSLFENGNLLYGHRSSYGVPTTKIEDYANTIGVIAALLATVTFTAAFTVPGGLDSSNGTPLLVQKAAFQVFMMADVVAMCMSVMVLFCLLWIMTTGHKKESILLLDVSVFLLQTSFHATLVTFMTGLYVTTISIVPAIAISTLVICTLLIILMHKRLVMWSVVPFFGMLIIWRPMLIIFANDQLSKLWSLISKPKCLRSSQNTEADEKLSEVSSVIFSE